MRSEPGSTHASPVGTESGPGPSCGHGIRARSVLWARSPGQVRPVGTESGPGPSCGHGVRATGAAAVAETDGRRAEENHAACFTQECSGCTSAGSKSASSRSGTGVAYMRVCVCGGGGGRCVGVGGLGGGERAWGGSCEWGGGQWGERVCVCGGGGGSLGYCG